jgi:hypothetical protein
MSSEHLPSFTDTLDGVRIGGPGASAADRGAERARHFDEAIRLMQNGRWRASSIRLAALADGGHPQAARIAMLFVRRGTSLFGGSFHATAQQRDRWQRSSD